MSPTATTWLLCFAATAADGAEATGEGVVFEMSETDVDDFEVKKDAVIARATQLLTDNNCGYHPPTNRQ